VRYDALVVAHQLIIFPSLMICSLIKFSHFTALLRRSLTMMIAN
jgi:hypothetical protein